MTATTAHPVRRPPAVTPHELLLTLALVALTVATWPLLVATSGPGTPLVGLLAHVTGMLAGVGVLALLLLVARVPALERDVGADVLARWHVRGGKAVVGLVVVHALSATAAWAGVRGTSLPAAALEVLAMPWLGAATLGTLLLLTVAALSVRAARRRLTHERWHGLHLLMYLAVSLGFAHQLAGPDLAGRPVLQVGWALLHTWLYGLVLQHRVLTPLRQAARHRLRVADVRQEGPGVVSIVVEGEHVDELRAAPGQFFRWRFLTPDHWRSAYPFSLSAAPTATTLRLTVKALGDGTRGLQDLPVGTWVVTEGPYGAVTSARRTRRDVLLIAGGVGITPMRALFEGLPLAAGEDLLLLYRARSADELVLRRELEDIAARRRARLLYVLGDDPELLSAAELRRLVPDLPARDVYLCGPPGLSAAVRTALRRAGLPAGQLHEERFAL